MDWFKHKIENKFHTKKRKEFGRSDYKLQSTTSRKKLYKHLNFTVNGNNSTEKETIKDIYIRKESLFNQKHYVEVN